MNKMRHRIFHILLGFVALVLMTGCRHDLELVPVVFTATLEQPTNDDGSKIYLDNERWIYWEVGDEISIAGDNSSAAATGRLINASFDADRFNGVFTTTLEDAATYFLGLHPMDSRNVIAGHAGQADFTAKIYLPDTQTRRTDERGDLTFDKQIYPMVGWYGDTGGDTANLDFHALAGIVRLNLFNLSGDQKTLKQIEITSEDNRQLKGLFNVNDYKIEDPYLTPLENTTVNQTVILYCGENGLPFSASYLHTFYLVLPALHGRGDTANYYLSMKVIATDNTYMIKKFRVPVRRTGLTNMQAMGITDWSDGSDASDNGAGTPGLSGCGTQSRPFKVYNINDLTYMRDCYNVGGGTGTRYINGQPITENTYITLMRSDIELTNENWEVGIKNFVGHFNTVSNMSNPGIIDHCHNAPLFESIGVNGEVDGITLKSAVTFSTHGTGVSPFCNTNNGTIRDCVITTIPGSADKNISMDAPFAGICVHNLGTIEGCRFQSKVELGNGENFAGICIENSGTVKGCQLASVALTLDASGTTAAGICYSNLTDGTVCDSYFAADVANSSIDWAGIVFENSGTVEHCYFSATGHIYTSEDAAGIVMNNTAGKVNYCWVAGPMRGVNISGIVQNLSGGQVINCFNSHNAMITLTDANSVGGGLVGSMSGGSIENSYVYDITMMRLVMSAVMGGIVGSGTGGTINNCYDYESSHTVYGNVSSGVTINHSYIVAGSQSGVTSISAASATDATGTSGCLIDLLNDDTYGAPSIDGAKLWQQTAAGTPPSLETYVITPPEP